MSEYPFRAPIEALCTHAACGAARNTSRVGIQTHSHASRVARNGRQEIGPFIRLSWLRTFQGHARGEGGRQ